MTKKEKYDKIISLREQIKSAVDKKTKLKLFAEIMKLKNMPT